MEGTAAADVRPPEAAQVRKACDQHETAHEREGLGARERRDLGFVDDLEAAVSRPRKGVVVRIEARQRGIAAARRGEDVADDVGVDV